MYSSNSRSVAPPRSTSAISCAAGKRYAWPWLCTTARMVVEWPPMNKAMPSMPSLPTSAISAESPSFITYSSETMDVSGKYA